MTDKHGDETNDVDFGWNAWVYCEAHVGPHETGWCSVPNDQKIKLDATTRADAYEECRRRGLVIHGEDP